MVAFSYETDILLVMEACWSLWLAKIKGKNIFDINLQYIHASDAELKIQQVKKITADLLKIQLAPNIL